MAVSAATVWEIRSTGLYTNGGGWVVGASGQDYSQSDTPVKAYTDLASSNGTTNPSVITSSARAFVANDVGNIIHVHAGTNWNTGFYQIVSVAGGAATLDRAVGAAANLSSGSAGLGGAYSPVSNATELVRFYNHVQPGNIIWWKSGTYAMANILDFQNAGSANTQIRMIGYTSTRGDACNGTDRPLLSFSSSASYYFSMSAWGFVKNFRFTSVNTSYTVNMGNLVSLFNCSVENTVASNAVRATVSNTITNCEMTCPLGTGVLGLAGHIFMSGCYIHDCVTGYDNPTTGGTHHISNCIFARCTTGIYVNAAWTNMGVFLNNTIYGTTGIAGTGIKFSSSVVAMIVMYNNIFANLAVGVEHNNGSNTGGHTDFNNFYNCTTDRTNWPTGTHDIDTDPQFVDASTSDFRVGTNMQASTSTMPFPLSTYVDIGGMQRKEDYPAVTDVVTGVVYGNTGYTGTYDTDAALVADVADAVWDEAMSGHTSSGTFGLFVQTLMNALRYVGLKD